MKARITSAELAEVMDLKVGEMVEIHPNEGPEAMYFDESEGGPCPYFIILPVPYVGQPNATEVWYVRANEVEILT